MKLLKYIFWIVVIIVLMTLFIRWTNARDEKVAIAADKYELCVKTQMNTTPAAYYNEHGEYPTCSSDQLTKK